MPRAKNPKVDRAEELFREGLKLKDIASQLELPEGTIRRWKSTYHSFKRNLEHRKRWRA